MSIFESSDIVLNLIFQLGGVKPQDNGAYAEELQDLPYPYVNKSNGIYIDIINKENIMNTEKDFIERVTFKCQGIDGSEIEMSFDSEGGIEPLLDKFKSFMLAMTYQEGLIDEYLYDKGNGVEKWRNGVGYKFTMSPNGMIFEESVKNG